MRTKVVTEEGTVRQSRNAESRKQKTKSGETAAPVSGFQMRRLPVEQVKPAAYNPRKDLTPADPEYKKLKRSMAQFGCVEPLVWNERSGNLVGGHQRFKVLVREFGAKEVDVSVVNLSPAREKALNVALNKIAGEWDDTALAELLAGLQSGEAGEAILTGFDAADIEMLIAEQVAKEATERPSDEATQSKAEQHAVLIECRSEAHRRKVLADCKHRGHTCVGAMVGGGYWREAE